MAMFRFSISLMFAVVNEAAMFIEVGRWVHSFEWIEVFGEEHRDVAAKVRSFSYSLYICLTPG